MCSVSEICQHCPRPLFFSLFFPLPFLVSKITATLTKSLHWVLVVKWKAGMGGRGGLDKDILSGYPMEIK